VKRIKVSEAFLDDLNTFMKLSKIWLKYAESYSLSRDDFDTGLTVWSKMSAHVEWLGEQFNEEQNHDEA
jgi:hypothetical protein